MKFREHRGDLSDSLTTTVEIDGWDDLVAHLKGVLAPFPSVTVTDDALHVEFYAQDDRIDWNSHIVTLDGYGVLGFTDGPCPRQDAVPAL